MLKQVLAMGLVAVLVACERPQESAAGKAATEKEGGVSGGGGYVSMNSGPLLEEAKSSLADTIERIAPQFFPKLPGQWNQNQLVEVVRAVASLELETRSRDGKELLFDYGWVNGQP